MLARKAIKDNKPRVKKERSIESRARVLTFTNIIKKRATNNTIEANKE